MSGANTKRIALVTGASRGIGRAVALELAKQDWRVIAVARAQKALEKLDDEIRALGGEATLIPLDLKDNAAIDVSSVTTAFGLASSSVSGTARKNNPAINSSTSL